MATKTISLELDAYEKLRRAKQGGESFSAVVRRARFENAADTLVHDSKGGYGTTMGAHENMPDYWDRFDEQQHRQVAVESFHAASKRQAARNRKWRETVGKSVSSKGRGWTRDDLYQERLPDK